MAVTIRDLSEKCRLSISTVSKALNDYSDVSQSTKDFVRAAAKELGYYPNSHARALKTKKSFSLGVLFADENNNGLTHNYFSAVLNSFKIEAERRGYDITFINHNIGSTQMSYLEHCHYREVDGVCIACIDFNEPEVVSLINSDLPAVTIDHLFNNRTCIQSENRDGVRMLVEHVYQKGHRKIAFVHGMKSAVSETRLAAFRKTCARLGVDVPDSYTVEAMYTNPTSAYNATQKLLALRDRPTCILMCDDYAALGGIEAIKDAGLRIPEDISVVGYDGIALIQLLQPRLTTIKQDTLRIGTEAARQLVHLIERPRTTFSEIVVIPCSLIEGETVAPPSR